MKRKLIKIAKELGFELPTIRYERPERDCYIYFVSVYKDGSLIEVTNVSYFTGDVKFEISKEGAIEGFRNYLTELLK